MLGHYSVSYRLYKIMIYAIIYHTFEGCITIEIIPNINVVNTVLVK